MSELYQRSNQVFVNNVPGGPIVDLQITWTPDTITTLQNPPPSGVTRLSVRSLNTTTHTFELGFEARHPLLDVCYSKTVSGTLEIPKYQEYVVTEGAYMVYSADGGVQYLVKAAGGAQWLINLVTLNSNITALLDFSNTPVTWPEVGSIVEPFNVIFDYVPQSVAAVVPHISGGDLNIPISGNTFTNTPITSSGGIIYRTTTAHNFDLLGNRLTITGKPTSGAKDDRIRSINGITAENGNITVKFLQ